VGRDHIEDNLGKYWSTVSIHAPAWGATPTRSCIARSVGRVSIHAPAWGATKRPNMKSIDDMLFQSTRPRGARLSYAFSGVAEEQVSIHAPAWGATQLRLKTFSPHRCFNPRARVGRDDTPCNRRSQRARFNPRARVGRDSARWPALAF